MTSRLEHLSYEERLRKLGLFTEEKGLRRSCCSIPKGPVGKLGETARACSDRTRDNGVKAKEGRFTLDLRKEFFTTRVMRY